MRVGIATTVLLCAAFAAQAYADVTVTMTVREPQPKAGGERTDFIAGHKLRTDLNVDGERRSIIIDADSGQLVFLDPGNRIATVVDLQSLAPGIKQAAPGTVERIITVTPRTRQLAGATCTVNDLKMTIPPSAGQPVSVVLTGSACLAKDGPGAADVAAFYQAAAAKGLVFGDPSAPTEPGSAILLMAAYMEMVARGLPLATDVKIGIDATGAMAVFMKQSGSSSEILTTATEAVSVSTAAIPPSVFAIPNGYRIIKP
jgi:hypothetical protein